MTNFIAVTDTQQDELNINVDHIILYRKTSPNVIGETIIITTQKEYQVMENCDKIEELITKAKSNS